MSVAYPRTTVVVISRIDLIERLGRKLQRCSLIIEFQPPIVPFVVTCDEMPAPRRTSVGGNR